MSNRLLWTAFVSLCLLPVSTTLSQETVSADDVSQEVSDLEAQLGKYNDSTPEAADLMAKLVELYHGNARVFGLIRIGQRFTTAHTNDPRHESIMLKLLDGLEATSRNQDFTIYARQFLAKYPKSSACADIERRLAETLGQMDDRLAAARAWHAVWNRQPNANGREAGVKAVDYYSRVNNSKSIDEAAKLAAEMFHALPAGSFTEECGWKAFFDWRRIGKRAESNQIGLALVKAGLPKGKERQWTLHRYLAENYWSLGQHANAAQSIEAALKIRDDQYLHGQLVEQLCQSEAPISQIETAVKQYESKHPDATDRWSKRIRYAHSVAKSGDEQKAVQILEQCLPHDAQSHSAAQYFVQWNGTEPERLKHSEKVLQSAIAKNEKHRPYLRYILGFTLYRDRIKDEAKTRQTLKQLVLDSPSNDGYTSSAMGWLLSDASDDDTQFRNVVSELLKTRREHIHLNRLDGYLRQWIKNAKRRDETKSQAEHLEQQLDRQNQDAYVKTWMDIKSYREKESIAARKRLLQDDYYRQLNDEQAEKILYQHAYYYRHYAPSDQRSRSAELYGQMAERFPKRYDIALWYLQAATDTAPPEVQKQAAEHLLTFKPQSQDADAWRRLLIASDKNQDPQLAKRALQWIQTAEANYGPSAYAAAYIGDALTRLMMENEAIDYWTKHLDLSETDYDCYQCAERLLSRIEDENTKERQDFLRKRLQPESDFHGRYAQTLAYEHLKQKNIDAFLKTLADARSRQDERPFRNSGFDDGLASNAIRFVQATDQEISPEDQLRVYAANRDLKLSWGSAAAELQLLQAKLGEDAPTLEQLLEFQDVTRIVGDGSHQWDVVLSSVQSAMTQNQYQVAATLLTGMLANIQNVESRRVERGRELVAQSYSRMGAVGLTIDESSPIAPLLQAALYLRLGDRALADETYRANRALFDKHQTQVPIDLLLFVSDRHLAAGGDENYQRVEDLLRAWLVKNSESKEYDAETKAKVQLLLAKSYVKAQRYDVARSEYQTVLNRYADTSEAIEAEFGIGETLMAQKVYDQAEQVFQKLAASREADVTVRAEFLRGVLAYRRGDRDDAREIFRTVLDRVPNVTLANQALFNLAEVYGDEERYMDQLNLLRTVGRLGRASKRWHRPGTPLSIVVQDSDLGISRGHNKIPVRIRTVPGGDDETIYLTSGGAGKGLFRADLDTRLGAVEAGDNVLQLSGQDVITCDYPDQFKQEFKNVALSDAEIQVAADADFEVASSQIVDEDEETFSQRLAREQALRDSEQPISQVRPANQVKPGNTVYLRVTDPDRDISEEADSVTVKVTADSGDEVQVTLTETEPHTGLFEGTLSTQELPAGALASDTAIEHSPLMAIDQDAESYWLSEPDGATPKWLTVDMKDLKSVSRVNVTTPQADRYRPVRGGVYGSNDGLLWFHLASHPQLESVEHPQWDTPQMTRRVYQGNHYRKESWSDVLNLANNGTMTDEAEVDTLSWIRDEEEDLEEGERGEAYGVVWSGAFVQERSGAIRIAVQGQQTGFAVDGRLHLPIANGSRSADVWLERGRHSLTIFAAATTSTRQLSATLMRSDHQASSIQLHAFRHSDFDLTQPAAKIDPRATTPEATGEPIELSVESAEFHKKTEQFGLQEMKEDRKAVGYWQNLEDWLEWTSPIPKAGRYEVVLEVSHGGGGRSRGIFQMGEQSISFEVPNTGDWNRSRPLRIGVVELTETEAQNFSIKPESINGGGLMDLFGVTLEPTHGESVVLTDRDWSFAFPEKDVRYIRFSIDEYLGEAVAVSNIEIRNETAEPYIPTETDVLALASNKTLEIAGGDVVTATYTDEFTQSVGGRSRLLSDELTATYFNAAITPIAYDFVKLRNGAVDEIRKEIMRIDPGERIIVEIVDYDRDQTSERDTVEFEVVVNDGEPVRFEATETEAYSGVFTKEVDTAESDDDEGLVVRSGDRVFCRYLDEQNTFPGHSVPRESIVYVTKPSTAKIRILETRLIPSPPNSNRPPRVSYALPDEEQELSRVAFEAPLTVEVIDPDAARDSRSRVRLQLATTGGATVDLECVISNAFATREQNAGPDNWPLREGRFVGQVVLQLGGASSPVLVPLSAEMPRNLIGGPPIDEENLSDFDRNLVTKVLNLTGQDVITATYADERREEGGEPSVTTQGRLISNGELACVDRDYENPIEQLHVGEKLFLMVTDADRDTSDKRDTTTVQVTTERGEAEEVLLAETLAHSGIFTGSLTLKASEQPTPGNLSLDEPTIETYFGDTLTVKYTDPAASTESGVLETSTTIPVVIGTDGLVAAFSKTFSDEKLAVETKFHISESYFELFKSHKDLGRKEEQEADLRAGRRLLQEVMEDYPDPKYVPRVAYLLGQFSQELGEWDSAIDSYQLIVNQYPEHSLAPDAQYKLAQAHEESGDFDAALEAYVTLAATYPKSPLIASVMIRISDHFYKDKVYDIAAQVGERFLIKFASHEHASRMAFRIGQCHFKAEQFRDGGTAFDRFTKQFPDAALAADALFWAGESYRMAKNNREAYRRYNKCRWDYPESEAAKYARGRLALPEMLQQFEADANSIDAP